MSALAHVKPWDKNHEKRKRRAKARKAKKAASKFTHEILTREVLNSMIAYASRGKFGVPKYLQFCKVLMNEGYSIQLYEARQTVSKYVSVFKEGSNKYRVRFSNHKPIKEREERGDCDFFVGHGHLGITTTGMAIAAVRDYFRGVSNAGQN